MLYSILIPLFAFIANGRRNDYSERALQDEITNLPGLPSGANYTQFSGYINVGDGAVDKYLFYWFVESLNDPVTDPVFYWTNGGPGCSGLAGFMTEQGPFRANSDGTTLSIDQWSWVNSASGIFIEQPVGVGFSYADGPVGVIGDQEAAVDAYHFIQKWLTLFSNYQSNDFYITSESYGGHYMPTLGQAIVEGNNNNGNPQINLIGIFVGNPFTNEAENRRGAYDTYYGKQMVSYPAWNEWYTDCKDGDETSARCLALEGNINAQLGGDVDPYALDYPVCNGLVFNERFWFLKHVIRDTFKRPIPLFYEKLAQKYEADLQEMEDMGWNVNNKNELYDKIRRLQPVDNPMGIFPLPGYQECSSNYATEYLNKKDVQNAIHAKNTTIWHECGGVAYNYTDSENNMADVWQWLIVNSDLHMMVISGDDDSVCGTIGTQSWIWNLGYPADNNGWNPWTYNDQVAGYFVNFDTSSANSGAKFQFGTVHSAGHMIPQTQPGRSLTAFRNFLADTWQ